MSDEIVRRLRNRSAASLRSLKESMPVQGLNEDEKDEELPDEETVDTEDTTEEAPEEEMDMDSDTDLSDTEAEEEPSEEDIAKKEPQETVPEEYPNPLDNKYAVKFPLGQEVVLTFANGTNTDLAGIIEGYDTEGFYRIKWNNGLTTNGMTDIAIAEMLVDTEESTCVCGSTEFVTEGKETVCDVCGRKIERKRENLDQLTLADKSRPKGKRLIRSEAHPMSTAEKPNISESDTKLGDSIRNAFSKKKMIKESEEDYDYTLLDTLKGEFWSRQSEMLDDIKALGYEVLEANDEYVIVWLEDEDEEREGKELQIPIGGTARTMTLDFDRARVL